MAKDSLNPSVFYIEFAVVIWKKFAESAKQTSLLNELVVTKELVTFFLDRMNRIDKT